MIERRCRYCDQIFQPAKYQPNQEVCSRPDCQRRRRADYHHRKIASDAEYRQGCLESARKWRSGNPDYWRRYREKNPAAVEANRNRQYRRDQHQRLRDLANNNSAFNLKHSAAEVWFFGPGAEHLANNNSARTQVWIVEALPPRKPVAAESCKQQPSGGEAVSSA